MGTSQSSQKWCPFGFPLGSKHTFTFTTILVEPQVCAHVQSLIFEETLFAIAFGGNPKETKISPKINHQKHQKASRKAQPIQPTQSSTGRSAANSTTKPNHPRSTTQSTPKKHRQEHPQTSFLGRGILRWLPLTPSRTPPRSRVPKAPRGFAQPTI